LLSDVTSIDEYFGAGKCIDVYSVVAMVSLDGFVGGERAICAMGSAR
jgi:hypothetical protein